MSTLAAARADNFYFPPEWDPKKGSMNKQQGQHPLRERAKKIDQGILVIRQVGLIAIMQRMFEMPFNVWCEGCGHLIGKGVRFNAEKQEIGKYHSTKIWSFTMSAPCCQQRIEVQTDPKNAQYNVVSGGKQKAEEYTAADAEVMELMDQHDREKLDDPLSKLEHHTDVMIKKKAQNERLVDLRDDSNAKYKNDYEMNKLLRKNLRGVKKDDKHRDQQRKALGLHEAIKLLPESSVDAAAASFVHFGDSKAFAKNWQKKRKAVSASSIFSSAAVAAARKKETPFARHRT
ncbi:MAG: hypothetical protein FRX49_08333 [Trebouxia sp. A1-2]|nr:MAG: hypothetical protein FRX49_08333 [Trebouxia sp. A1-2]